MYRLNGHRVIIYIFIQCLFLFISSSVQAQGPEDKVSINNLWAEANDEGTITVSAYITAHREGVHIPLLSDYVIISQDEEPIPAENMTLSLAEDPLSLVLVIDNSVAHDAVDAEGITARDHIKETTSTLIRGLRPGEDFVSVYTFTNGDRIVSAQTLTNSPNEAINAITRINRDDSASPDQAACVYHAIHSALDELPDASRRRAILVITSRIGPYDEGDCDVYYEQDVMDYANRLSAPLFVVGFDNTINDGPLERLAAFTGGQSFVAHTGEQLDETIKDISSLFQRQYQITYETNAPPSDYQITIDVETDNFSAKDSQRLTLPIPRPAPTIEPTETPISLPTEQPTPDPTDTPTSTPTIEPVSKLTATSTSTPTQLSPAASTSVETPESGSSSSGTGRPDAPRFNNWIGIPLIVLASLILAYFLMRLPGNWRNVRRLFRRRLSSRLTDDDNQISIDDDPDRTQDLMTPIIGDVQAGLKILAAPSEIIYHNISMQVGDLIEIERSEFTIGRNTIEVLNDLHLGDPAVSREHAQILFDGNMYLMANRKAEMEKTTVNGIQLGSNGVQLFPNTLIQIIEYQFQFQYPLNKDNLHDPTEDGDMTLDYPTSVGGDDTNTGDDLT